MAYNRTADGHDGVNDGEDDNDPAEAVTAEQLQHAIAKLTKLRNERKLASERITDASKEVKLLGVDMPTFNFILRLSRMEPEDRERFLFLVRKYTAMMRYEI